MIGRIGDIVNVGGQDRIVLRPYNSKICNRCNPRYEPGKFSEKCKTCSKLIGSTVRVLAFTDMQCRFHGNPEDGFSPWKPFVSATLSDLLESVLEI